MVVIINVYRYVDLDFTRDLDKRRFISRYVFTLARGIHHLDAESSRNIYCIHLQLVEYIIISHAFKEAI